MISYQFSFLKKMEFTIKFIKFRRKHLYLLILINLITLVKSDSCTMNYGLLTKEGVYYCNHNQTINTCQSADITGLVIHEPNKEDGTADVEFDFDSNCIYELSLKYVKESEENCEYSPNNNEERHHSAYKYEGRHLSSNDVNPTTEYCSKKGVIKLKHLASGCYKLEIKKNKKYKGITIYKFFIANKKKINFTDFDPLNKFKIQYLYGDGSSLNSSKLNARLTIIHPFFLLHPNVFLKIISYQNTWSMHKKTIFNENIIPFITKNKVTTYRTCNSNKNDIEISCRVEEEDDLFICDIIGVKPGIYTFEYTLNNIIQCFACEGCTYWRTCSVPSERIELKIPKPVMSPSQISPHTSKSFLPWIIIIIIILCLLVIILIFVIYHRKCIWVRGGKVYKALSLCKTRQPGSELDISTKVNLSLIVNEGDILLLYPRDAKEVMSTMEAFRNALKAEGFQVFDIFDKDLLPKINEGPNKWISDILDKNTTKVIIVRTYCGKILLAENSSDSYKSPDCRDNLFVFAMARLREYYSNHDIFTVDVGMNTSYPHHLNRGAIYDLPENIQKLLQTLRNNSDYTINVENNNEWNEFTTSVKLMQDFVENKTYLTDLLKVDFEENRKLSDDFDTDIKENNLIVSHNV